MLSILIPTYNYNITRLVADLHQQAMDSYVDFEIIVMEDGSKLYVEENKIVADFEFCRHIVLENNIGRSAVRNKLADEANYGHLLFMDCDAEVSSEHFVEKYISFCREECVVIGGTAYDPNENNTAYSLRLKYGREREARTAIERDKNNFATFNFLISASIFNRVRFDETIRGYGHEDMLFGHQLHQLGYEFIQIENPLIHKGLDDNETFLKKTEEGTRNLFLLSQTGRYPFLMDESKLLHMFIRINKLKLTRLFALKFDILKSILVKQLCVESPSLLLYDLYKILFLCKTSLTK
ncbi:MAG: glycosyltransferase family 2 protein [Paludibacter sp.]